MRPPGTIAAIVTGAGRGMGRAVAIQLAEAGANVVVVDTDAEAIEDTCAAIKVAGRESLGVTADIGDRPDVERVVTEAKEAFGRIDILVNNAGLTKHLYFMDLHEEEWDRVHRTNAKGVYLSMQRVAKELIDQGRGGRMVNIAPIDGGSAAGSANPLYAANRGAVLSMTRIAAIELGQFGITVNAICPRRTLNTMAAETRDYRSRFASAPDLDLELGREANIPVGKPNDPEDIAAMAVFLTGPGARNITGQMFDVDGGWVTLVPAGQKARVR